MKLKVTHDTHKIPCFQKHTIRSSVTVSALVSEKNPVENSATAEKNNTLAIVNEIYGEFIRDLENLKKLCASEGSFAEIAKELSSIQRKMASNVY